MNSRLHAPKVTRYVRQEELAAFGAIAARPIGYQSFTVAAWNAILDGLVVFREEVVPGLSCSGLTPCNGQR